jgi:hypothetical protein
MPDAINNGHLITILKTHYQFLNEGVNTWCKSTTGDYGSLNLIRMKEDSGTCTSLQPLLSEVQQLPCIYSSIIQHKGSWLGEGSRVHISLFSEFLCGELHHRILDGFDISQFHIDYEIIDLLELCSHC